MTKSFGFKNPPVIHWLDLPHIKDSIKGRKKWILEVLELKNFLEKKNGKIKQTDLLESIKIYRDSFHLLTELKTAKRTGRLSSIWFMFMVNTFFLDLPSRWNEKVKVLLSKLPQAKPLKGRIFLAGSPIFFPNFKTPFLLESSDLNVVADDLCSSERLLPGVVDISDQSLLGLIISLAGRYHQGCLCPTFSDNDRRVNNILNQIGETGIEGVIFVVLKGCHPYDIESYSIESLLKNQNLKFIRLETDYGSQDNQNLLTRLEAFRSTLDR
jgi:benzoyl-CoA reductase/2-hydroxyglutaryl-CoA dehydratase subunit BcrC/BadD/HgdB